MDYVRENVVAKAEFQADRNVHIDLSPFLNLYHFQPQFLSFEILSIYFTGKTWH